MVQMIGRPCGRGDRRERATAGKRSAFDDAGEWIGTATRGGAVFDADGVQIGVEWPGGEVVDFGGMRIGHL
jgi:hypothetical protein